MSNAICSVPTATCIQSLINALFRSGDQLKTANTHWANLQTKVRQKRFGEAQARATDLVTFGLKNFYAGKLLGGMSQLTADNLAALTTAVYQFACLAGPSPAACQATAPVVSPEALDEDGAAAVITPQSPTTLVITPTKQGGVLVPAGAVPVLTVVSVARLPDSPGPLLTSLDQFPLFYEFTSSPEVTFNTDVTTGVCQSQDFDPETYPRLRLAHNVGPNFGDVEILPRVNAPFLDCTNATEIGTLKLDGLTGFAATGWNIVGRTIGPLAKAVFLPDELHAAVLGSCCLGGSTRKFSPHGAVDPESNLGSINFNPDADTYSELSAPVGTAVTPAPSVIVKSNNGTPIANVPVTFAVGEEGGTVNGGTTATVTTDADGIATVTTWTLGIIAGTYTLTATPPAFAQAGTVEPYKPAVSFSPTSLQFTATATAGPATTIAIQAGDNQSAPAGEAVAIPPAVRVTDQYGNVVSGFTVTFSVGSGGGTITGGTAVTDAGGVATVGSWTLGPGTNTLLATAAGLSGSPVTFTAAATGAPSASGSDLIVFNDVNVLDNPNNVQLYTNLVSFSGTGSRASGKSVLIHRGHNSLCPTEPGWCGSIQPAFWTTLTDRGYTIIHGDDATAPITSIGPDVKLIILTLPRQTYSNAEINSLKAFAGAGGRILFVGEYELYYGPSGIATENDFLTKMGSAMQNTGGSVDCDWHLLPSSSLRPHQVTAGLTELWMACSSVVQPGPDDYPLFYDTTGELVLGAVADLDLTPLPEEGILTAVQGIDVAPPSAQSERLSYDPVGRGVVAKIPGVQR